MSGPFETEHEAMEAAIPYPDSPDGNRSMLLEALTAAGVQLGEYDRVIINGLAGQPQGTCAVVASLIARAAEPIAGAQSPGAEQQPGPARH